MENDLEMRKIHSEGTNNWKEFWTSAVALSVCTRRQWNLLVVSCRTPPLGHILRTVCPEVESFTLWMKVKTPCTTSLGPFPRSHDRQVTAEPAACVILTAGAMVFFSSLYWLFAGFPPHLENLEKQGQTWKTWKNRGF